MNHSTLNVPRIGVGCLVMDASNQVLLVKRAHPPQQGFWHLPGGKLEWGESVGACAEREVLEETGLEIVPGPIIAVADRFIEGFHYVILDVLARVDTHSPPVSPSSDALDAVWVSRDRLLDYPLVEGLWEVINSAVEASGLGLNAERALPWLYLPVNDTLEP